MSAYRDNVDPDTLSDQKSTIAQSVAARSYLSNRLSRGAKPQVKSGGNFEGGNGGGHGRFNKAASEQDRMSQSMKSRVSTGR